MGVASLPLPHAQQVATVALDSQGFLHLFFTPLSTDLLVWDAHTDAPAAGLAGTGQQGMSGAALSASRAAETSQDPERAGNGSGSGELCRTAVPLPRNRQGPHLSQVQLAHPPVLMTSKDEATALNSEYIYAAGYCLLLMCI